MIRLTGLPQFLAVCSTRNLTVAAQSLGVSQPALTQAIGKLAKQLGVPLFDRSTRPLSLTAYGEVLFDYARNLERSTDGLVDKLEEMKTGSGGLLRVGAGPDWIHEILPVAIGRLQDEHPDIRVALTVALNDALRAALDAGAIDMFFASVSDAYFGSAYETRILLREQMMVVARRDHPVHTGDPKTLEELSREPWVMTGDETFGRQLVRRLFGQEGLQVPVPSVETNSVPAMINILRCSRKLGFLSRTHMAAYADISEVRTVEDTPLREGGVTWRRDAPLVPAAENLLGKVEEIIAEHRIHR